MMRDILNENLPFFSQLDAQDQEELAYRSYTQHFALDEVVLTPEDPCENLLIILSGRVKSLLVNGKTSLLLYYLDSGDICTLASTPMLYGTSQMITIVSASESDILKIPSDLFDSLREKYPQLTSYLRSNFIDRFADILFILNQIAFSTPSQRVASYLYDLSNNVPDDVVNVTQETISRETGMARSLVSTVVNDFEAKGIIEASHGRIRIKDQARLSSI